MKNTYFFTGILLLFIVVLPIVGNTQNNIEKNIANEDLSIQIDKKDASGKNTSDGYIKLKVSGGVGPYTIHCFSPYSLPTQTKGNELNMVNIKSGDYLFVIQDNLGKSITREVNISN